MSGARFVLIFVLAGAALALAGCGGGDESTTIETSAEPQVPVGSTLQASVGPGFEISLQTESGEDVTTLAAGEYTIDVDDKSSSHNFHLSGPGVDESSDVGEIGSSTLTVTVEAGTYEYVCDPHESSMSGEFEVVG